MTKLEASWLQSQIVDEIIIALGEENVRFVGGAVRDTLIGRPVVDIDAATTHKPDQTMELLQKRGLRVIPTGLKHGTVTAVLGGKSVEITTLRVDVETDGRHAEVAFTDSWQEDAKRRDFTFNALYVAADGTLFDPFGGIEALKAGRVEFIGAASDRIQEDALRIMRYFRFYAHYGQSDLDPRTLRVCSEQSELLRLLSHERIRDELLKLLSAPEPLSSLMAMAKNGIFNALGVADVALLKVAQFLENEEALDVSLPILNRLFLLFSPALNAEKLVRWLKLSNKEQAYLQQLEQALAVKAPQKEKQMRAFIYIYGKEAATTVAVLKRDNNVDAFFKLLFDWEVPVFSVSGRDLLEKGVEAGPDMGATLKKLENYWVKSDFTLDKSQLLARL